MLKINRIIAGMVGVLTGLAATDVRAQMYEISWYTIDGGGVSSSTGGGYALGGTIGQPDAAPLMVGGAFEVLGGFWPGISGRDCSGSEQIRKAACKLRNGNNLLKVVLIGGVEADTFTVTLEDGATVSGTVNARGKGKAKFTNRPPGEAGTATARWGCGATAGRNYVCP